MSPTVSRLPRLQPGGPAAKRLLDTIVALLLITLLSPVLVIVAVLVMTTSSGPLIYCQKRVGRQGRVFHIFKFRTMYQGSDRSGPLVTSADDQRVTPIGRWLRDNKLDELPQLFNVLKGDMSLVGPRPQVPRFVNHFEPNLRNIVLGVRPGITGPTAVHFRHEEQLLADKTDREGYYIQQILPVKLEMDAHYVRTRTFGGDFRILMKTIFLFVFALLRRVFFRGPHANRLLTAVLRRLSPKRDNVDREHGHPIPRDFVLRSPAAIPLHSPEMQQPEMRESEDVLSAPTV